MRKFNVFNLVLIYFFYIYIIKVFVDMMMMMDIDKEEKKKMNDESMYLDHSYNVKKKERSYYYFNL